MTCIKIINIIDNITDKKINCLAESFIFKFGNDSMIVSTHHFKPIIKTLLYDRNKTELVHHTINYWNELQIFKCPDILEKVKSIKSYRTRFIEKNTPVFFSINNITDRYNVCGYDILYHTPIQKSIYMKILLSNNIIDNFKGCSGTPVFDSNNNLIGIFCKMRIIDGETYGYILPVIYLIRTLEKKDNKNLYFLDIDNYENMKIGNYEVDSMNTIYYQATNCRIPLEIYYSLEGDMRKTIICKQNNVIFPTTYDMYNNFDISLKLIHNHNLVKLNTASYIMFIQNNDEYNLFIKKYMHNNERNIWFNIST